MAEVTVKLSGFDGVLKTLRSLPPEVVSKRGGPVKRALRRGGLVLLRESKLNLARSTESLGEDDTSTGLLQRSLILSRGKPPTGQNGERYLVRIKQATYKDRRGQVITTVRTGNWLEFGTEKQPAEPWARPAFNSKSREAVSTIEAELKKDIDRTVARLARQNRG